MFGRISAAFLASLLLFGCAGSGTKGTRPSWRKADAAPSPSVPQRLVFAPSGVGAVAYNRLPYPEPRRTAIGEAIVTQVHQLSLALGKAPPIADGRLAAAADDLAAVSPERGTVSYQLVEFALHRHGIVEPSPHLVVMRASEADQDAILRELEVRLSTILAESNFARVGVGVAPQDNGDSVIVLALQSSSITTQPIPRSLQRGSQIALKGQVAAPFRDPHVYVTRESGDVETLPLQIGAEGAFTAQISCKNRSGKQQIEITASDHTGSTVLANFPLWCGVTPPEAITVEVGGDDSSQYANATAAEAVMVEMINRDRKAHGLAPVAAESRLGAVSRAHSKDMYESGFVGHVSPNTGNASDRVLAGGIRTAVVLENVARAYGLREAQDGLMNSPGHRANILSKSATHVGVGIVLGKLVADRREMFVSQVFIAIPADIDHEKVVAEVARKLRAHRPLQSDQVLAEVAQNFATALATGSSTTDAAARATAELHTKKLSYRGVTTLATTVADLASFEAGDALADKTISHFGIGVAQGDHAELGEKAISIVVLFGHQ